MELSSARLPHDMPRRRSRCDARLSSRCVRWYSCELAFCTWVGLLPCLGSKHLRIRNLWAETGGRASASRWARRGTAIVTTSCDYAYSGSKRHGRLSRVRSAAQSQACPPREAGAASCGAAKRGGISQEGRYISHSQEARHISQEATCDMPAVLALEVALPPREPGHELRLLETERLQGLPRVLALATARAAARSAAPTARSGAARGDAGGGAVAVAPASAVLRGRGEQAA
mgnify:CR=1 FL=1